MKGYTQHRIYTLQKQFSFGSERAFERIADAFGHKVSSPRSTDGVLRIRVLLKPVFIFNIN